MKKLKKGTVVVIFECNGEDKINYGYSLGVLESIYSTDERIFCNVTSYDEDGEIKYNSLEYDKEVMTLEDYKSYLINRLSYNNERINSLVEDNGYIFKRIEQIESYAQEETNKLSLRRK